MTYSAKVVWMKAWRDRNPAKLALYAATTLVRRKGPKNRKYNLKAVFGVENTQVVDDMLAAQDGRCAICIKPLVIPHKHTHLDHDHVRPHRLRGILCHHCNVGLGHFKDRPNLLRQAAKYLDFYTPKGATNGK